MEDIFKILDDLHPEFDYRASEDYIEDGLLDSFDMVMLVSEMEQRFGVCIDALDILPDNFCTAQAMAELVKKNGGKV